MLVWAGLAVAFAGKWDGESADVVVKKVVPAPAGPVHTLLADWHGWQAVMPASCASEWEIPSRSAGVGARSRARYTIGPMGRRLVGVVTKDQPGLVLELELEGKKGWFVQVTYREAPEGATEVTLNTPLTAPKWPVTGVFFRRVKPAWEACYASTLDAIAARVAGP